jgi:hypothetical protein
LAKVLASTAISVSGIIVETVATIAGEAFTPIPGVDGVTGFTAGVAAYNSTLNPIENTLSVVSLGLVAIADAVESNHTVSQITDPISGQEAREYTLGADTSFSLGSVAVGNTPLTPDAFTDTFANLVTLYYDVTRLIGDEPAWGLRQLRVVRPENDPGYLEIIKPDEEEHHVR